MEISVIASGSNGNSCLVEQKGVSLLIDAGKSGRELEKRMNSLGKSLENVDALVLTHAHSDHVCGAGVIHRRFGIPIYATKQTIEKSKIGKVKIKHFDKSKNFRVKKMVIKPVRTSHSVDSSGFVIDKFGLFTDTGRVTCEIKKIMPKLKSVLMEFNHDIDMLKNGPYPYYLKQQILSDKGHLCNIDACNFLKQYGKSLEFALLGHLSGNNNTPQIASKNFEEKVSEKISYCVCNRNKATGSWKI